ncbi:MAG TPA: UpxY family transcription antiterminator [Candidatus Angelobacter sp.]|jgi:transcription antitermination factor NusG|nr:UpxY family transcription antiterminator [Candidatus Angelobacter sp.]
MASPAISSFSSPTADVSGDRWFAVYTRAHHEKSVAEQFGGRDIAHFLPMYTSVRRWKDRIKTLQLPLFAGYLFVKVFPSQFLDILRANGVARLVGFPKPEPLKDNEIQQLQAWLSLSVGVEPHPYLRIGQRVRVCRGPLTDVEGILIRKKNLFRLVVAIDLIQRAVALEIDAADILPLGNGRISEDNLNMPLGWPLVPDLRGESRN